MSISSPFNPDSPQTQAIFNLFIFVLIIGGVIFSIVSGLVIYIIIRYRRRPGAGEPRQVAGNRLVEIIWTVIPSLIILAIFIFTFITMNRVQPPTQGVPPDLVVTAHQWWWAVRYPKSGAVTANEIHIPVEKRLLLRVESADVIHDFAVPQLTREIDAIPGHPNHIWMEAHNTGTYLGTCAEFCGPGHAWMRIRVVVQPEAEFNAWQQAQLKVPAAPTAGAAAQGAQLFLARTCQNCHALAGTPAKAQIGPDLTHLASRRTLAAGTLANTPQNLARWLADPPRIKPGALMPKLQLKEAEIRALVAYLEGLQ